MTLVVKDRVKETTATTGTGTLTLAGAVTKFQSFSVVGDGNTTYYAIESGNGSDWEVGIGTYTASGTTLSRDTILESSNAGSAINLSGTSTVFCTYPAERSVNTADIGSTIQAYDADTAKYDDTTANFTGTLQNGGSNVVVDTDIGSTVQGYDADTAKYDDATANFTGTLQNGGSNVIVDTDIGSTVQGYDADTAKYDDVTANFTGNLQKSGANVLTGNQTITLSGDVSGSGTTAITVTVADDSHNHIISNVDGLQTALDAKAAYDTATSSTGYFDLPAGTTAQRPGSPATGMVRYNTDESSYEAYDGSNWVQVSTQNYTYDVEYLVVAGGGGSAYQIGGYAGGGGGGAGGYLTSTVSVETTNTYTVTVGGGGAGGTSAGAGGNGTNSVLSGTGISTVTSIGGGGGGGSTGTGNSGGSGGGGSGEGSKTGGSGTTGQGTAGGNGVNAGGGGGGANNTGANAVTTTGGNGGNGKASSITGSSTYYAGGGGGGAYSGGSGGTGGLGGGGNGGTSSAGTAGTVNTGGGGGGIPYMGTTNGVAGGSGVVILRMLTSKYSGTTTGSPTVTTDGSYTVLKYTSSGSYTA